MSLDDSHRSKGGGMGWALPNTKHREVKGRRYLSVQLSGLGCGEEDKPHAGHYR
jgi:hypothetical protein